MISISEVSLGIVITSLQTQIGLTCCRKNETFRSYIFYHGLGPKFVVSCLHSQSHSPTMTWKSPIVRD